MGEKIFEIGFKVFITIGLGVVVWLQIQTNDDIVYVDSIRLMNGYKGMIEARKAYESKVVVWNANVDSLKTELETKIKEYQAKQVSFSAKEKILTEELLQAKQQQYLNYQQVIAEKIQKEDQELTAKVVGKVNGYIKRYGEEHGYSIILAATQYGNLVYSVKEKDITDAVLAGLNSEYGNK